MKMKLVLLALALMGLSACGGQGPLAASGNAQGGMGGFVGPVLQTFASLLKADVTTPQSLGFNIPTFVSPYDGCRSYVIGSSTSDNHYKIKFDCRNILDGADTMNWLGTYEFKAEDAADTSKGYRQDFDMTRENVGSYSDVYKGFDELKKTANQVVFESDLTVKMKMKHSPPVDWEWRRAFKSVYTPDDMAHPGDSGKLLIQGHFGVNGQIGGGPNGEDLGVTKFTFEILSKDLVYDKNCQNFKSGTVTFKDGAGNALVYTHSCTSVTVKWNGQPFTW